MESKEILKNYIKHHNIHITEIRNLLESMRLKWYWGINKEQTMLDIDNCIGMAIFLREHLEDVESHLRLIKSWTDNLVMTSKERRRK